MFDLLTDNKNKKIIMVLKESLGKGLRFVVAGCGMMGKIGSCVISSVGNNITGVLGKDETEVDRFLEGVRLANLEFKGTLDDYDSALERADAVYLATPPYTHIPLAKKAIKKGKHVLCEKPLGANHEEVIDFRNFIAHESTPNVAIEINSQYRHHEILGTLKKIIAENEVEDIELGYLQDWQKNYCTDIGWRPEVSIAGFGKLVGDLGVHKLMTLFYLFGGHMNSFNGKMYNLHPIRYRLKNPNLAITTFEDSLKIPTPSDNPDLWLKMDMLDRTKYSGDDITSAEFLLEDRLNRKIKGNLISSQVSIGNLNNFYIKVKTKNGDEYTWWQEDPNHLDVLTRAGRYQRIERSSAPSQTGCPGGHPHGYRDAMSIGVDKFSSVALSGDKDLIQWYSLENTNLALKASLYQNEWISGELIPYKGQVNDRLNFSNVIRNKLLEARLK